MKISEIKNYLATSQEIAFELPSGELVPSHFHVTEVGIVSKKFIDCGGTLRDEKVANFQLWSADDYNHRLHPEKLIHIINLSEKMLGLEEDLEIEVEYQGINTIGKYNLDFNGKHFLLTSKQTDCLAREKCEVPQKLELPLLQNSESCCSPESTCC